MTLIPARTQGARRVRFAPAWRRRRSWQVSALLVRVVQVVLGIAVFVVPQHHHVLTDVLLVLGLLTAVISPARNGPGLLLIGALGSWLLSDGAYTHPPLDRVLPFAVAVFLLWSATSLAATCPVDYVLRPELVRHWLVQSGIGLAVSAPLIAVVYGIDAMTSGTTTPLLQFAGVVGVLVVVAVGALLFTRTVRVDTGSGSDAHRHSDVGR